GAPPAHGAVVFALLRASKLKSRRYVDRFFDTGRERQHQSE
ncbi:MAG: hypothetical protein JWL64_1648, partial [Frankiales bacterium]|nr:hypothetical protein [Frankiales bacterium]